MGFRFRLHDRRLPGRPDLVFPSRRAVIEVKGCFWHGHDCHLFKWPNSRREFWRDKIASNIVRDARTREQLLAAGWRVGEVWECQVKGRERRPLDEVVGQLSHFLWGSDARCVVGADQTVEVPVEE